VAILGKNIWGAGPSSFGRQQRLSEITIEPIKNLRGGAGQDLVGGCAALAQRRTATAYSKQNFKFLKIREFIIIIFLNLQNLNSRRFSATAVC